MYLSTTSSTRFTPHIPHPHFPLLRHQLAHDQASNRAGTRNNLTTGKGVVEGVVIGAIARGDGEKGEGKTSEGKTSDEGHSGTSVEKGEMGLGLGEGQGRETRDKLTDVYETEHFKPKNRLLPIISGLACPFSVLLDIPGLTERWYVKTYGYDVVETQPNPPLLYVALSISILCGLIANGALVARFLEKKPWKSTLVAIFALTVHDLINIATVTTFGAIHSVNDGFTYGDAFWMSVAATCASLTCNVTLIVDLYVTPEFLLNGSGLTEKQRSLVIAVMALLCYIGLGSLCFSFLITPSLTYINSLYFTICTITSVGFGDITPNTTAARIFSFFYDIVGLGLLAFNIGVARETVIETFESSYRLRREKLAIRARQQKEAKRLRLKERKERRARELLNAVSGQTPGTTTPTGMPDPSPQPPSGTLLSNPATHIAHYFAGSKAMREDRRLDYAEEKEEGQWSVIAWMHEVLRKWGWMKPYQSKSGSEFGLSRTLTANSMMQEESYKTFRKEIQKEQDNEFRVKIGVSMVLFWSFWLVGALAFHFTEGWSYFDALYFCFICFTTIGYGDFSPQSSGGRVFYIIWSILGIAQMTLLISVLTESWSSRYKSSISESKVRRKLRGLRKNPRAPSDSLAFTQLLAVEGYTDEDYIEPHELPAKLAQAVKGFHDHARYFMHGRSGDTPVELRNLIDAADDFDDELIKMRNEGMFEETGAMGETRHFLFMISYERTFDALLEAADQLSAVFAEHAGELEKMRALNEELRISLEHESQPTSLKRDRPESRSGSSTTLDEDVFEDEEDEGGGSEDEDEEEDDDDDELAPRPRRPASGSGKDGEGGRRQSAGSILMAPFYKTPPGGPGDDLVDEALCEEIDAPLPEEVESSPNSRSESPEPMLPPPTIPATSFTSSFQTSLLPSQPPVSPSPSTSTSIPTTPPRSPSSTAARASRRPSSTPAEIYRRSSVLLRQLEESTLPRLNVSLSNNNNANSGTNTPLGGSDSEGGPLSPPYTPRRLSVITGGVGDSPSSPRRIPPSLAAQPSSRLGFQLPPPASPRLPSGLYTRRYNAYAASLAGGPARDTPPPPTPRFTSPFASSSLNDSTSRTGAPITPLPALLGSLSTRSTGSTLAQLDEGTTPPPSLPPSRVGTPTQLSGSPRMTGSIGIRRERSRQSTAETDGGSPKEGD